MRSSVWKWFTFFGLAVILMCLSTSTALADDGREARVILGGSFTLGSGQILDQNLVAFGGDVILEKDSLVNGDVALFGGSLTVAGKANGDVAAFGGRVVLASSAVINGDLVVLGSLEQDPNAQVRGSVVRGWDLDARGWESLSELISAGSLRVPVEGVGRWDSWMFRTLRFVLTSLALMAIGALIVVFVPRHGEEVAKTAIGSALVSLGLGLLTFLVVALAIPLLVIICVGIPVAVVLVLALCLGALFGWLVIGLLIGRRVFEAFKAKDTPPVVAAATGVAVLSLLSAVPCVGPLFTSLVASWGLGAVVLTRFGTVSYPPLAGVSKGPQPHVTSALPPQEDELSLHGEGGLDLPAGEEPARDSDQ